MTYMEGRAEPSQETAALDLFDHTRARSMALVAPLNDEDMGLQSMEDASPPKWHLAHTTWFFEEFILKPSLPGYQPRDDRFALLFNSYYVQAGPPAHPLQTRPPVPAGGAGRDGLSLACRGRLARRCGAGRFHAGPGRA
ncbi:DinB family protein [Roseibium salinum]|nr:DinB family protein [Roseibium salinum]